MFFKESYLAVDIGSVNIKVTGIKQGKEGLEVTSTSINKLPRGTVQNGLIKDPSAVASLLSDIFREIGRKPRKVVLTIPGNTLIIRQIQLPVMSEEEINEAIKWEAEDYLPFPVEEAALDLIILGKNEDKMRVLLVAVKKEVVSSFLEPFKKIGVKPVAINVQPLALTSLVAFQNLAEKPVAVIDIGASGTRVIIGDRDSIYLARNIDIGGQEFTRLLMERKRLSYQQAEEFKFKYGLLEEIAEKNRDTAPELSQYISEGPGENYPLTGLAHQLSDEISRSLTYNPIEYKEETIETVYLTGGGSRLKGLVEIINQEVKQEVIPLDPFKGLKLVNQDKASPLPGNDDEMRTEGDVSHVEFAIATGLALNRFIENFQFNLLGREKKTPPVGWNRVMFTVALIIFLVVPGFIYYSASSRLNILKSEVSTLRQQLEIIRPRQEEYFQLKEKIEVLEALSKKIESARYYWDKVLLDYGYVIPEKARLNFVQVVEGSISLGGYASNNGQIIEIIRRMQQSPFFKIVQIKKLLKEGEVNFRIDAEVIRGSEDNDLQNE